MLVTRNYLCKPVLAAALALAIPLYAQADLLPAPATHGENTAAEHRNSGVGPRGLLANCTGPGCQPESDGQGAPGGGQGSAMSQRGPLSAANGGTGNNGAPPQDNAPLPSPPGNGNALGTGGAEEPGPPFSEDRFDSEDILAAAPALEPATDYLRNPRNYVVAETGYCVDQASGAAFNQGVAANDGDCGADGYFVSGNPDEVVDDPDFSQALNDDLFTTAQLDPIVSQDLADSEFGPSVQQLVAVPTPGTLLLLGAGLLFLGTARRRTR